MNLGSVLFLPVAAMRATAVALRALAATGERLADALSPQPGPTWDESRGAAGPPRQRSGTTVSRPPATRPPAVLATATQTPAPPVDVARLASMTAPQVVAALDGLGSTELAELYEHEAKHRRRRSVLQAIETAAAPPQAGPPGDETDVRTPDELVYSTQTPRR